LNFARCHGPLYGITIGQFPSFHEIGINFDEREKAGLLTIEFLLQIRLNISVFIAPGT